MQRLVVRSWPCLCDGKRVSTHFLCARTELGRRRYRHSQLTSRPDGLIPKMDRVLAPRYFTMAPGYPEPFAFSSLVWVLQRAGNLTSPVSQAVAARRALVPTLSHPLQSNGMGTGTGRANRQPRSTHDLYDHRSPSPPG